MFHPPKRPRDLAWRRATMSVRDGPDGEVYLPAIYDSPQSLSDSYRLGHATDWSGEEMPMCGIGQRVFLAGDDAHGILELAELRFAP
jgi:type VI secretion system protein ImpE